jgi:hypothetical protein
MQFDIYHLLLLIVGFLIGLLKEYIQQRIFVKHLAKVGELEEAMGFGLNETSQSIENTDKDSKNINPYYRGFYS